MRVESGCIGGKGKCCVVGRAVGEMPLDSVEVAWSGYGRGEMRWMEERKERKRNYSSFV